jgi:hypothetical protein
MRNNATFEIGLVMAGAISAGAYSAGVIDFIIEALDAYEQEKHKASWSGPRHDIKIPVMTGASAGGMTAALAALHFYHDIEHVWPGIPSPSAKKNRLYSTWVNEISIERLLETKDLNGSGVRSFLCCAALEEILQAAFDLTGEIRRRPWVGGIGDQALTLMLTLTNLRGVPYSFEVFGDRENERYGMLNHRDDLEFTIGIGPSNSHSAKHWLDIAKIDGPDWELFKKAALATGAFPGALAPRILGRPISDYTRHGHVGFEREPGQFEEIHPDRSIERPGTYNFICVDGGAMDNEPFELTRRHLAGGLNKSNPRCGEQAHRAVLLVDPFPNFQDLPQANTDDTLFSVMSSLFGALKDQARFKPQELELAASDHVFSRFMIAPSREPDLDANVALAKAYPIASSALGAFGGFLHESFRRHDYLLGRRNAQAFLRWHFALPETNKLFEAFNDPEARKQWYVKTAPARRGAIGAEEDYNENVKKVYAKSDGSNRMRQKALPIIPLVDRLKEPIEIGGDDLPQPYSIDLDGLRKHLERRADAVYSALMRNGGFELKGSRFPLIGGKFKQFFGGVAWRTLGRDYLVKTMINKIEDAQKDIADSFGQQLKH